MRGAGEEGRGGGGGGGKEKKEAESFGYFLAGMLALSVMPFFAKIVCSSSTCDIQRVERVRNLGRTPPRGWDVLRTKPKKKGSFFHRRKKRRELYDKSHPPCTARQSGLTAKLHWRGFPGDPLECRVRWARAGRLVPLVVLRRRVEIFERRVCQKMMVQSHPKVVAGKGGREGGGLYVRAHSRASPRVGTP